MLITKKYRFLAAALAFIFGLSQIGYAQNEKKCDPNEKECPKAEKEAVEAAKDDKEAA